MIYKRREYVEKYGVYNLRKNIKAGKIHKISNGYYSDDAENDEINIIRTSI